MTFDLNLDDRSSIALEALDSFELGATNYLKAHDRIIRDQGFGASDGAQVLIKKHLADTAELVTAHIAASQVGRQGDGVKELMEALSGVEPEIIALVALQTGLQSVAGQQNVSRSFKLLGRALEAEVWASGLRTKDAKLAARLDRVGRKRGSLTARRQAVRTLAAKNGYEAGPWKDAQHQVAGKWLVEVLLQTPIFVLNQPESEGRDLPPQLTITEEALAYSQEMTAHLLEAHPVPLPLLAEPRPWADTKNTLDCNGRGYDIPLLRRTCHVTRSHVKQASKEGRMERVYGALNAIQGVAWSINERVVEMVRWAYENGVEVEGLPTKTDLSVEKALADRGMPEKLTDEEWEAMADGPKRLRRRIISKVKEKNRGLIGERMTLDRDLSVAGILAKKGNRFWTPYNMDYRGRVYSVPHFGFQRQDYVRAMFQFAEGKPLGERGLYWLKVHLANCGDFDKVSKKPFEDRVAWVDDNDTELVEIGTDPKWGPAVDYWTKADSPFLFLAACIEFRNALRCPEGPENYVCHIPVSFDGSCSGLQHLAAMTRCQDTAGLVNVSPTDKPQDVYQTVADKAKLVIQREADGDGEFADVARLALAYGVNRSLVKRNVMTYSYSSPKFGMITQQMDDTMRPLSDKVIEGKLDAHPFEVPEDTQETENGTTYVPGRKAAKFLGSTVFDTIEATVHKPAEAMTFLQGIAKALAHEAKPVIWYTPLGLPVVLRCPQVETKMVSLWLSDKGVRLRTRTKLDEEKPGIDKRAASNAIAPSFVHSMDACHLQMVCLEAQANGINNMALVHDSFGCLPADAEKYREIIRSEFVKMYAEHDVLEDIRAAACDQIDTNYHRIPELPMKGALDVTEVLKADYAFA